jgi:hypothetical protein
MEVTFANSSSGLTRTDWTRNLSLHLASGAGSSFIACSSTARHQPVESDDRANPQVTNLARRHVYRVLCARNWGGRSNWRCLVEVRNRMPRGTHCLGAVVLT